MDLTAQLACPNTELLTFSLLSKLHKCRNKIFHEMNYYETFMKFKLPTETNYSRDSNLKGHIRNTKIKSYPHSFDREAGG